MRKNRLRILVLVLILVVISGVGGWVIGASIISPEEAAARTAPPTPSAILVPIEERVLTSNIITRGTARFGSPQEISIVPSILNSDLDIITSQPEVGSQFHEGDVFMTVSGRPVFILQGDVPVFRDLIPGMMGEDVRQLEKSLARLGFNAGEVDGVYDNATSDAVTVWYLANDWEALSTRDEQIAEIRSLELALAEATNRQLLSESAELLAPSLIDIARANAEQANLQAEADVITKQIARDLVLTDAEATDKDLELANAELDAVISAQTAIALEGETQIQQAINAQELAEQDATFARGRVEQIRDDLTTAQSESGVWIPADEIVFVPSLPVRIDQLSKVIGDRIGGAVMTVTNDQLTIDSSLPLGEAPLVTTGMEVVIDETNLGVNATGVVSFVADTPGTFGVDGFHIYFEVLVDETPQTLEGFSLRLTIPVESTTDAVMVVPVSALSLAMDGASRIQVEVDGQLEFIEVETGLSADGLVEVTPVDGTLSVGQKVVIGFEAES